MGAFQRLVKEKIFKGSVQFLLVLCNFQGLCFSKSLNMTSGPGECDHKSCLQCSGALELVRLVAAASPWHCVILGCSLSTSAADTAAASSRVRAPAPRQQHGDRGCSTPCHSHPMGNGATGIQCCAPVGPGDSGSGGLCVIHARYRESTRRAMHCSSPSHTAEFTAGINI